MPMEYWLRPSMMIFCFMRLPISKKSGLRNSFHSVMSSIASALFSASYLLWQYTTFSFPLR